MRNILDVFSNIEDDVIETPVGTAADEYNQNKEIEKTEEIKEGIKEEKKPKRQKSIKDGVTNLTWKYKKYRLSRISQIIVDHTELIGVTFISKIRGFEDKEETDIKITKSWIELLGFLIGSIKTRYGNGYEEILSSFGIVNDSIQLRHTQPIYLDAELSEIELYNIPELNLIIEHHKYNKNLYNSICKAVKALGFNQNDIQLTLYNPNNANSNKEHIKRETKSRKKDKEYTLDEILKTKLLDKPLTVSQDKLLQLLKFETKVSTIKELLEIRSTLTGSFNITGIIIDNEIEDISGNLPAMSYFLSYLIIIYEDQARQSIIKNTIKNEVGVTDNNQKYFGVMKTIPLQDRELHFYYNGLNSVLIEFIANILKDLQIDLSSISFRYEISNV